MERKRYAKLELVNYNTNNEKGYMEIRINIPEEYLNLEPEPDFVTSVELLPNGEVVCNLYKYEQTFTDFVKENGITIGGFEKAFFQFHEEVSREKIDTIHYDEKDRYKIIHIYSLDESSVMPFAHDEIDESFDKILKRLGLFNRLFSTKTEEFMQVFISKYWGQ